MPYFHERLRECRKGKDQRQEDIAARLGVSLDYYKKYEAGTRNPRLEKILLLAEHFAVTVDYLLGRTNNAAVPEEIRNAASYNLGRSLRILREGKGATQEDVARVINLETRAYGAYEQNANKPGLDGLIKLADFFGVSVDRLLGRGLPEDGPQPQPKRWKRGASFPESLRKLLEDRSADKRRLASWLKISVKALDNILSGKKRPDPETLVDLADYFGVTLDELLGREP